jgi:hypothetical protein
MRTNAVQALLHPFRHCATTRYPEQKSLRIIAAASCLRAARERGARTLTHETLATAIAPRKARRRPWRCSSRVRWVSSRSVEASRVAGLGMETRTCNAVPGWPTSPGKAARLGRVASSTLTAHTDTEGHKTYTITTRDFRCSFWRGTEGRYVPPSIRPIRYTSVRRPPSTILRMRGARPPPGLPPGGDAVTGGAPPAPASPRPGRSREAATVRMHT